MKKEILMKRMACLYDLDNHYKIRVSHDNAAVKKLYDTYLKELGSHEAHHLLHTRYYPRVEE